MMPGGKQDQLSAEKMQLFVAGLSGLPPDEVRKAKVLYVRNAIAEYRAARQTMRAFGFVQLLFAVIPCFWPILIAQHWMMRSQVRLFEERITNAMDVWRADLEGERLDFDTE